MVFPKLTHRGVQPPESSLHKHYKAKGASTGERACNSRTSCIEGEILAVTKFKSCNDTV